ncbi:MAG: glycosyltransferase family 39 protein [Pseudomonadota bacterium]|nr:glycosyltransferase family 39 protein [Pseudomonadota bacterium]
MATLKLPRPAVWLLLLGLLGIWFYALGARALVPTDEGRYAEMAREMVATGDWITTRLNGIKYFEKPPLQVWMTAASFELFGLGEWQARLWTGLCGLLGVVAVGFTGRRVFGGQAGNYAAAVLASSILWDGLAHVNTLDMGLSAMMAVSLCALLIAQSGETKAPSRRNWMLVCWAGMALAVLSKGLIGIVLPGAVLTLYILATRDWKLIGRLQLGLGLLLFFVITAPWFILVSLKNPEFAHFFFIHEHFQRFTSKIHHRAGPLYYFVPILLLGMVPWLGALAQSFRPDSANLPNGPDRRPFRPKLLLLVWSGFIFVFFSVSSSKLPSYILPILPAIALLLGDYLTRASARVLALNAGLLTLFGIVGLAFMSRLPRLSQSAFDLPLYQQYLPWVGAAAAIACVGGIAALLLRAQRSASIYATALGGFLALQALMFGHDGLGRYAAGIDYVPRINAELDSNTQLYSVNHYEQSLPFYLRRTSTLVGQADEMSFGLEQEPALWLPDLTTFIQRWQSGAKAVAVMSPDTYAMLQQRHLAMRVIVSDPRRVMVSNQLQAKASP